MELEPISYEAGGRTYTGFLADGAGGGRAPGVLVIHEGGGLTGHTKERASRLAELGYVAFAMDLFGPDVEPPTPGRPDTMAKAQAVVRQLRDDVTEFRARVKAGLGVLQAHPHVDAGRLAAIGYCLGGAAAIELARTGAPLQAVAGFHAGILPGSIEDDRSIRAKLLLCHGEMDPVVPASQIQDFTGRLTEAGVDWQLHLYGGVGHSFTNPGIDAWNLPGFFYDEKADRRSWAAMLQLFDEAFA
jgi:dienelactone hydrolase